MFPANLAASLQRSRAAARSLAVTMLVVTLAATGAVVGAPGPASAAVAESDREVVARSQNAYTRSLAAEYVNGIHAYRASVGLTRPLKPNKCLMRHALRQARIRAMADRAGAPRRSAFVACPGLRNKNPKAAGTRILSSAVKTQSDYDLRMQMTTMSGSGLPPMPAIHWNARPPMTKGLHHKGLRHYGVAMVNRGRWSGLVFYATN